MTIYLKPYKKILMRCQKSVLLKDIAIVFTDAATENDEVKNTVVFRIHKEENRSYLVNIIDIFEVLLEKYPGADVVNLGNSDCIVSFRVDEKQKGRFVSFLKVSFVSSVLFLGSATAIISFHVDSDIPLIFRNYYYAFFKEYVETPFILDIPYAIGVASGIIVFFNHFKSRKNNDDPTPIEIELNTYKKDSQDCVIDKLEKERKESESSDDSD